MTAIEEFMKVRLINGVVAVVMETFNNGAAYLVEIETAPDSWDTRMIKRAEIASILTEKVVDI